MTAVEERPKRLTSGPGTLLVWFYGVMVVGAVGGGADPITADV
ncbi:hypothetical protein ACFV23_34500 [Streptomyces sp. NPDC059627]